MTVTVYARGSGRHVAERVQPAPGSARERQLAALAANPETDWYVEGVEPKQPTVAVPDPTPGAVKPVPTEEPKPGRRPRQKGGED